jgi:hypothetical protein
MTTDRSRLESWRVSVTRLESEAESERVVGWVRGVRFRRRGWMEQTLGTGALPVVKGPAG